MIRPDWDTTWMSVADVIAKRSPCSRRQVGAVIVDPSMRIVATGYNGFPAELMIGDHAPVCAGNCPRAQPGHDPGVGYDDCLTVHAEANALMFCDRRDREGGWLYVTSAVCFTCSKQVANSGLEGVVMRVTEADRHRSPQLGIDMLRSSGLEVIVWED